jgi:hypothetical protein
LTLPVLTIMASAIRARSFRVGNWATLSFRNSSSSRTAKRSPRGRSFGATRTSVRLARSGYARAWSPPSPLRRIGKGRPHVLPWSSCFRVGVAPLVDISRPVGWRWQLSVSFGNGEWIDSKPA